MFSTWLRVCFPEAGSATSNRKCSSMPTARGRVVRSANIVSLKAERPEQYRLADALRGDCDDWRVRAYANPKVR